MSKAGLLDANRASERARRAALEILRISVFFNLTETSRSGGAVED